MVNDKTSKKLEPDELIYKFYLGLMGILLRIFSKFYSFNKRTYDIARSEPKKVVHCLKVGLALSFVSFFYYMRPLYKSVGGNAMWAVMTVVVVFEYTVGQTLLKCINRVMGTFLAGSLGIGIHWFATQFGEKHEPFIAGLFIFILASSATFSRFIPTIKARFDYGAMIFILTFSLVSVAGYRVDKLFDMAHYRVTTIAIGTSISIITSLVCFPVWAGSELHLLITRNMDTLADSTDGCVEEYFDKRENEKPNKEDSNKKMQGYKCVLNSKATEDSMANFARWEPAHGPFNFQHPWMQYLKIAAHMRSCARSIGSLTSCINSELRAPELLKKSFIDSCTSLSSHCSKILKELAVTMKTMTKSSTTSLSVTQMNSAVQQLQNMLKSLPPESLSEGIIMDQRTNTKQPILNLMGILPLATATSLLIEIAGKIEGIVHVVDELANLAEFKPATDEKSKDGPSNIDKTDDETIKVSQKV